MTKPDHLDRLSCEIFDRAANAKTGEAALEVCAQLVALEREFMLVPKPWYVEEITAKKPGTCIACKKPWNPGDRLIWRRGETVARHRWCYDNCR